MQGGEEYRGEGDAGEGPSKEDGAAGKQRYNGEVLGVEDGEGGGMNDGDAVNVVRGAVTSQMP